MTLQDLPVAIRNQLDDWRNQYEGLAAHALTVTDDQLTQLYQQGLPNSLSQFASRITPLVASQYSWVSQDPWLQFGMTVDQYQSQATTFATEYKKVTGQEISAEALHDAFGSLKDMTGGLLTGGEYAQRLMNDQNIQKTYGWVKYGYDYNQFQQQKLQMRSLFGRDLSDQEATTQLQYLHAAQGGNHEVTAQTQQSQDQRRQASTGVSGSVIR